MPNTSRINNKKSTPRHTIVKLLKVEDKSKFLKATKEKQHIACRGVKIQFKANFSSQTMGQKDTGMTCK